MMLNFINEQGGSNKVIEVINDETALIVYKHFEKQYNYRIAPLTRLSNHRMFNYDMMLDEIIKTIKFKYKDIIHSEKSTINIDIPIIVGRKKYFMEISTIIKASYPHFNNNITDKRVRPEYLPYYRERKIRKDKKVITIETVAFTIKCANEWNVTFKQEKMMYNKTLRFNPIRVSEKYFINFTKSLPSIRITDALLNEIHYLKKKAN